MAKNLKKCKTCLKSWSEFRCACGDVYYCGKECQTQDWEGHKDYCLEHLTKNLEKNKKRGRNVTSILFKIGNIHQIMGRPEKATVVYEEILSNMKMFKNKPENTESQAEMKECEEISKNTECFVLNCLGTTYLHSNRPDDALDTFKKSLNLLPEQGKVDTPLGFSYDRFEAYMNICQVFQEKGDLNETLAFANMAKEICERSTQTNPLRLAVVTSTIARIYADMHKKEESLEMAQEALRIVYSVTIQGTLSNFLSDYVQTMTLISLVYRQNGRLHEALEIQEDMLALLRTQLGEKHLYVREIIGQIGHTLHL